MDLLTIDESKCTKCRACVQECPIKILSMKDKETFPSPVPSMAPFCINCGHCVAVCPEAALVHRDIKPEDCMSLKEEWILSPEKAEHFLRYRRSIRSFKKKPVEKEILQKLIGMARYAPSGHNTQPVQWAVIYEKDELTRLLGIVVDWMRFMMKDKPEIAGALHFDLIVAAWELGVDTICRGAPHVVLVHGHENNPMAHEACLIAMTYLELASVPLGLGPCWAGYFKNAALYWPPMKEALGLPEGHITHGAMMIGYPKYRYHRMPPRNEAGIIWK